MANISTKFNLDDFVWGISSYSKEIKNVCTACNGNRKILLDSIYYTCPKCYGSGQIIEYEPKKWNVCSEFCGRIGNIKTETYDNGYDHENEIRYMLSSTGVGSGTLWHEEDLFLTQKEAQEECDRRNRENGWITEAGQI
jgi:hypothetical protein